MTPIEALLVGLASGAGLVLLAQSMQVINQRLSSLKDIQAGIESILSGGTDRYEEEGIKEPGPVQWDDDRDDDVPAIPFNPAQPPVPRTFNPDVNRDPRDYPVCNCHNQRLTAGEQILWWPQPEGGVMIFHPEFIQQAAKV